MNIARNVSMLLAIKLNSSISRLAAEFDAQNTMTKKANAQPGVTQIIIAQKVDQIL